MGFALGAQEVLGRARSVPAAITTARRFAAGGVWIAGIQLSNQADVLAARRHLGAALGGVNREAIEEAGKGSDILFFSRSGYTKSPGISTLFWVGDQLQSWDGYSGFGSAITGIISGGFSGFSLAHSDTGGFDSITVPIAGNSTALLARDAELLLRWAEFRAFTSVFRTHAGINPEAALPPDTWVHVWTGNRYNRSASRGGTWIDVPAPIGEPPVFLCANAPLGQEMLQSFKAL